MSSFNVLAQNTLIKQNTENVMKNLTINYNGGDVFYFNTC